LAEVDKTRLVAYLERIDEALTGRCTICVYGSAAFILLDQPARIGPGVDAAAPYGEALNSGQAPLILPR